MVTLRRNRIVSLFIGLLLGAVVYSQPILQGVIASSMPTASTHLADILIETYDDAGYDLVGWDENIGAGSTYDNDNTDIADETSGNDHILLVEKISPNFNARARIQLSSPADISYTQIYVYVSAEGATDGSLDLFRGLNSSFAQIFAGVIRDVSGTPYFRLELYNDGTNNLYTSSTLITLDTWYKFEVKIDETADTWEWRIDGVSQDSGGLTGTTRGALDRISVGDMSSSVTYKVYFNNLKISSTGYPTQ